MSWKVLHRTCTTGLPVCHCRAEKHRLAKLYEAFRRINAGGSSLDQLVSVTLLAIRNLVNSEHNMVLFVDNARNQMWTRWTLGTVMDNKVGPNPVSLMQNFVSWQRCSTSYWVSLTQNFCFMAAMQYLILGLTNAELCFMAAMQYLVLGLTNAELCFMAAMQYLVLGLTNAELCFMAAMQYLVLGPCILCSVVDMQIGVPRFHPCMMLASA